MDDVQGHIDQLSVQISELEEKALESQRTADTILAQHQRLLSWADLFMDASIDEKKMVAASLIKAVTVTQGYGIQVEFHISEAQYLNGMEVGL